MWLCAEYCSRELMSEGKCVGFCVEYWTSRDMSRLTCISLLSQWFFRENELDHVVD